MAPPHNRLIVAREQLRSLQEEVAGRRGNLDETYIERYRRILAPLDGLGLDLGRATIADADLLFRTRVTQSGREISPDLFRDKLQEALLNVEARLPGR